MNFVIISLPRTGSSMLVTTLNSIPGFNVYGELLAKGNWQGEKPHPQEVMRKMIGRYRSEGFISSSYKSRTEYLKRFFSDIKGDFKGFKLLFPHITENDTNLINYINTNFKKIFLHRENMLKVVISGMTNKIDHKIVVDPAKVVQEVRLRIRQQGKLFNWFKDENTIEVCYEKLTKDLNAASLDLSRELEFLGYKGIKIWEVPIYKYGSNKLEDRITNYDELAEYILANVPNFDWWLD